MPDRPERPRLPDASDRRRGWWPAAVLVTSLPLLVHLARETWTAPFPVSETVAILADAGIMADAAASPHTFPDATLAGFFDPGQRSWYRPLYWATWYAFWHTTHSLDATLLLFRLFETLVTLLLVLGFMWQLKPRTLLDWASALVAVNVLVGMPGFRDNLELPLLMTLVGMLFALAAWILLERDHRVWHAPLLVALVALAVGYKEQGLVLVPLVVAAWWAGAPGVRASTAAAVTILAGAYLAMRFSTTGAWRPFEQDVGLGFSTIAASDAAERFGAFPYWIYAYNAAATIGNILFSEPTGGTFQFLRGVVEDGPYAWEVSHVFGSTATTVLLGWWAVRTWRRDPPGQRSPESRLAVALVVAVAASGALGFNYSRDRLGGMAVVFYALASYHAVRAIGAGIAPARRARAAAGLALALLSASWQARAIGTVDSVRERALNSYRHWIADRAEIRLSHAGEERYLRIFEAMAPQGLAPVPERRARYEWLDDVIGPH